MPVRRPQQWSPYIATLLPSIERIAAVTYITSLSAVNIYLVPGNRYRCVDYQGTWCDRMTVSHLQVVLCLTTFLEDMITRVVIMSSIAHETLLRVMRTIHTWELFMTERWPCPSRAHHNYFMLKTFVRGAAHQAIPSYS